MGVVYLLLLGILFSISEEHVLDQVPLIDGHNDLPNNFYLLLENKINNFDLNRNLTDDPLFGIRKCFECHTDIPRLLKGKVGAQFWVAYVDCNTQYKDAVARTLEQIDVIKRFVTKYSAHFKLTTSHSGILEAFREKKIASLIAIEGGHSIDSRLAILRIYYELGVRYMTLTHMCNTPWADASPVDDKEPVYNLTAFGERVVKEMNRLGMMVDISHVSYAVMNKAIEISKAPVIFSHSSSFTIRNHHRNVRDDTLNLLRKNNGVVMINFCSVFIRSKVGRGTLAEVAEHISYIAKKIGVRYVGIGADYDGVPIMPVGLDDVSKYPQLFDYLKKNDPKFWTDANLKLLAGNNLLRVFKDVEKVRDRLKDVPPDETWISKKDLNAVKDEALWKYRTRREDILNLY